MLPLPTATPAAQQPTRVRHRVVGAAILLAMVTYLDRSCIGKLAPDISRDFGLSMVQMSGVFSAFAFSYMIFEIPTAWWADRLGTRVVLTRIVAWWSVFTIATAGTFGYVSLLITRFLFGAGEAGAWPCMARTFSRWIPVQERGTAKGVFFAGAYLSGGLTPPLVVWLLPHMHWRMIFVCFGFVGFAWVAFWWTWFRNDPTEHAAVNAAERELILKGRPVEATHVGGWAYWRHLLRQRNMILLCTMYMPNSVTFYFCITWLPTYLHERHGFEAAALGFVSGLPLLLSVATQFLGGFFSDRIAARRGLRLGRRVPGIIGYSLAAVAMFAAASASAPVTAAVFLAVATASCMFTTASAWGTSVDIGRENCAVVSAAMNTAGQAGSIVSPFVVAYSVKWFGNWNIPLYLLGGFFVIGVLCWFFIDPEQPLFPSEPEAKPSSVGG